MVWVIHTKECQIIGVFDNETLANEAVKWCKDNGIWPIITKKQLTTCDMLRECQKQNDIDSDRKF